MSNAMENSMKTVISAMLAVAVTLLMATGVGSLANTGLDGQSFATRQSSDQVSVQQLPG